MREEILENVLEEFTKIAKIPRPSGHEKAVSDYLYHKLSSMGFQTRQDEKLNIIADKPACLGYENAPLTILQAHMDMVCVAKEGVSYDPLQDPINLKFGPEYLEAVGTSLGADDGLGVAEIIYIMEACKEHGPLRAVFTVDEEQGMSGAIHLAEKYLSEASFLINCDSENYDELTVGSAGSVNLDFSRALTWKLPEYPQAWKVTVRGLRGGHSGECIGNGHGNAIRLLAMVLLAFQKADISFDLAAFHGGKARNAIPAAAEAVAVTNVSADNIQRVLLEQQEHFKQIYGEMEPEMELLLQETALPQQVFSADDTDKLLHLLVVLHTGVYGMSQVIPGLVETSANLGVVDNDNKTIKIQFFPRSAIDQKIDEFRSMAVILGNMSGFEVNIGTQSPGWKERKDSRLATLMRDIFEEQNHIPMKVETIHAGLECGWYFLKNPKLDMVSIGVTTMDIHSPNEKLLLKTIVPQVKLIIGTLHRIAEMQ